MNKREEEKLKKQQERLEKEIARTKAMSIFEEEYKDYPYICGIDEVGRGPLAGPVVAGAVILPKDDMILYLNDSKKLSEKKREMLYDEIMNRAVATGIGMASPARIDEINILQATYEASRTKERLLWAVDTANLGVTADRLTYIAVECNYEESLLGRSDRIPSVLKDRIRHSHFEVSDVIRWLHKQDLSGVLTIWLLHLSAGNSRAEAWQRRFEREFPGITIRICEE